MTATGGSARSTTASTAAERIPAGPAAPVPPRSPQRPAPPARFRFPALDGLRGPAVLLVIGFSLRGTLAHLFTPAALRYPFDGGFAGIDVLLVLTGFLICQRLLEPDGLGLRLSGRLFRRFLPLHLAAWAIALCWVAPTVLSATSTAKGTPWNWLCAAALLSGFVSAGPAGYSLAWVLSVGLWVAAALITLTVFAGAGDVLLDRIGPLGRAAQFGRPTRLGPGHLVRPALLVGVIAAAGGGLLLLTGVQLGDSATISATYQNGGPAVGRALLGLGTGMLTFLLLRVSTGPLGPPTQQLLLLRRRFPPGIGAGLALVGLGLCVYRFDLVTELHLIPVFPVAAALVYFAAQDDEGRVHRALAGRSAQWLGARATALFVLHPAVLICVLQVNARLHANLDSALVSGFVVAEFAVGALAGAELGHRYLDRRLTDRPAKVAHSGLLNVAPRIQSGLAANPVPRPTSTGSPAKVAAGANSGSPGNSAASPTTAKAAEKAKEKESTRRSTRTAAKATTTKPKPKPIDQAVVSPQLRLRSTPAKKGTAPVAAPAQPTAARTAARTASTPTRTAAAATRNSAAKKAPAAKNAVPTTKSVTARKRPAAPTAAAAKKKATADQSIDVRKSTVDLRKTTVDLTPDAAPTPANPPAGPRGTGPKAKPAAPKKDETP